MAVHKGRSERRRKKTRNQAERREREVVQSGECGELVDLGRDSIG